ncbi:MAG: DUF853 family protein [Candidatus Dadabacteria bacterium]|nr:MAG: DUF853 family protein [Candidatus Dadabacteria bacterium]
MKEDNNTKLILLGANPEGRQIYLIPGMCNRHGLIAGATGTGKTVTLQVLAENFSRLGVPVFSADIKGDLSGISQPASPHPKITERIEKIGIKDYTPSGCPVLFWDVYGKNGHPVRTTISEMGPLLLSHLLELNDTQEGVLHIAFAIADDQGLLLLDLKDLRALLSWMAEHTTEIKKNYGNVSPNSIAAIQRDLLVLQEAGGDLFFGEPALKLEHLMQRDFSGRGVISLLDATTLIENPRIYGTFLLWLLSELFEELDEVGDAALPRLVFFFDEAHLLFNRAQKPLIEKIEQVVRLIRSKGVGIFFVTQHPLDIPESVAGQLGNRVQHALRAFTDRDKKAVRAAAETFRANPAIDAEKVIIELGVGEALVSTLDYEGAPSIVERTLICPPLSRIGPVEQSVKNEIISRSPLREVYDKTIDRESAYEVLKKREEERAKNAPGQAPRSKRSDSKTEAFIKSLLRSIGSSIGRQIARGLMGSITRR